MTDELLTRRLRDLEGDAVARPAFLDELHDELAAELGLPTRRVRGPVRLARPAPGTTDARRSRTHVRTLRLLLAATLLLAGSIAAIVGAQLLTPRPDLLATIRSARHVRVGVSSAYPQVLPAGGGASGFDVDVADSVATEIDSAPQLIVLPPEELVADPGAWDLAVVPLTDLATNPVPAVASHPVLAWPVQVLVPASAAAATLEDLRDTRLCVVLGSVGARWAEGRETGVTPAAVVPSVASILPLASDTACVDALDAGRVDALVTDTLGPADLAMRPRLRPLGSPVLEVPRVLAIAADGPDPATLRSAVDAAIDRLRANGTLHDLSLRRLGVDLTSTSQP